MRDPLEQQAPPGFYFDENGNLQPLPPDGLSDTDLERVAGGKQDTSAKAPLGPMPRPPLTGGDTAPTAPPTDIFTAPLTKPFGEKFQAPPMLDLGGPKGLSYLPPTPTFTGANAAPTFTAPTMDEALNEPGFAFGLKQGQLGIENWAGAKGTLNDSSTAKALSDYNRAAAGQDYSNVFNRKYQLFNTDLNNWTNTIYNPTMLGYSTTASAGQHQNDLNYQNAWNAFLNRQNEFYNWQDRTFGKQFQTATA